MQKDDSLKEVYERLGHVEKKLADLQVELEANQKNYDLLLLQLNETASLSDNQATVAKLAAGIAHEIRNPLTTVKGFIQLIKPYLEEIGKDDYATVALDEINRADDIIFQFLNASKPQHKHKTKPLIDSIVKDVVLLFESEAKLLNIALETNYQCTDAYVCIDGKELKQVLINLIKNAMEAIDANLCSLSGILRITTAKENGFALITIEDNGIGMEEETIGKLFTPFFTTKKNGTGIGLSVCRKIIETYSGTITVKSKRTVGTTFQLSLPLSAPLSLIETHPKETSTSTK